MLELDPVASFRIWSIEFDLGSRTFYIPPLSAADWFPCLMRMDLLSVLDLAEGCEVDDLLLHGEVTRQQFMDAVISVVESVAGRPVWSAVALCHLAVRYWSTIGADLMRASVKFDAISLSAALDAIYGSLTRGLDPKLLQKLNATLEHPPADFQAALGIPYRETAQRQQRERKPLPAAAAEHISKRPKTKMVRPSDRRPSNDS